MPGWEHRYEVNADGVVRSLDMRCGAAHGSIATRKGRVLKLIPKNGRYLCVTLADKERRVQYLLHDIVAAAFHGPKPPGLVVRHLDDVKANNRATNLCYGTHAENYADTVRNGISRRGESHGMAKLTEEQVRHIRASAETPQALAAMFCVVPEHVWAIKKRRVWKHVL